MAFYGLVEKVMLYFEPALLLHHEAVFDDQLERYKEIGLDMVR